MNKQQLKQCFDRIEPSEELILSTLTAVRSKQRSNVQTSRSMPRYAFVTRLASAACALVLIIGVGVMIARQEGTDPLVSDGGREGEVLPAQERTPDTDAQADGTALESPDQLIAKATEAGGDWMVLQCRVDAFYAEPDKHPGTGRLSVTTRGLLDARTSDSILLPATDGQTLDVEAKVSDALFDAIGADITLYVTATHQDGQPVWTLSGFAFMD